MGERDPPAPAAESREAEEHREALLLAEYGQALEHSRLHDWLARENNTLFLAFFVALTALIEQNSNNMVDVLVFGAVGTAGSLLFLGVGLRTRAQHGLYTQRACEIEEELGLDLMRRERRLLPPPHIPPLRVGLSNKTVFLAFQIGAAIYFVVKIIVVSR